MGDAPSSVRSAAASDASRKPRRVKWLVVVALAVGVAVAVGWRYLAPQPSTRVDDVAGAQALANAAPLKAGAFTGADDLHEVTGTVALHETADGRVLRFTSYEATPGPDVFFYLAQLGDFDPDRALRLQVAGGAGEGQATLRGTFSVPIPADAPEFSRVVVWCKRFGVPFGSALLH